jgi:hypothetical protein
MSGDLLTALGIQAVFDKKLKVVTGRKRPILLKKLVGPSCAKIDP